MLEFCTLILQINFFVFPISAGFLTYRKIKGKPGGRFLRMTVMSFIMIILSYTGVVVNETPERRQEIINNLQTVGETSEEK